MKKLPIFRQFRDYHDIKYLDYDIRDLGFKCKEIHYNDEYYDLNPYWGIIYRGNLRNKVNRNALKKFLKQHYMPWYKRNCNQF